RRLQRDLSSGNLKDDEWTASFSPGSLIKLDHDDRGLQSYSVKIQDLKKQLRKTATTRDPSLISSLGTLQPEPGTSARRGSATADIRCRSSGCMRKLSRSSSFRR
ncbi:jg4657, partial [Pararge aegeria aegeria]